MIGESELRVKFNAQEGWVFGVRQLLAAKRKPRFHFSSSFLRIQGEECGGALGDAGRYLPFLQPLVDGVQTGLEQGVTFSCRAGVDEQSNVVSEQGSCDVAWYVLVDVVDVNQPKQWGQDTSRGNMVTPDVHFFEMPFPRVVLDVTFHADYDEPKFNAGFNFFFCPRMAFL